MSNSTQSRTEKKIKQAPITDFITRKSPPKSITAETLCAEEEDESYWKALAEERQSALNTTLEENQDLTELIQTKTEEVKVLENEKEELIQENKVLKKKTERIDELTDFLNELVCESGDSSKSNSE